MDRGQISGVSLLLLSRSCRHGIHVPRPSSNSFHPWSHLTSSSLLVLSVWVPHKWSLTYLVPGVGPLLVSDPWLHGPWTNCLTFPTLESSPAMEAMMISGGLLLGIPPTTVTCPLPSLHAISGGTLFLCIPTSPAQPTQSLSQASCSLKQQWLPFRTVTDAVLLSLAPTEPIAVLPGLMAKLRFPGPALDSLCPLPQPMLLNAMHLPVLLLVPQHNLQDLCPSR